MSKQVDRMEWFERRLGRWMEHAARLGLTADEVAQLGERLERAREAHEQRRAAWAAAQAASREFDERAGAAGRAGLRLLKRIREAAEVDPELWGLAGVEPRAGQAPPHAPCDVEARLCDDGSIVLGWNGAMAAPAGTSFVLERRLADRAGYRFLGITAQTSFRDANVPGAASGNPFVCYRILARRGPQISEYSEPVMVKFVEEDETRQAA